MKNCIIGFGKQFEKQNRILKQNRHCLMIKKEEGQMIENKNMVIAIEWADKVTDEIKKFREQAIIIYVKIEYGNKENERLINWSVI